MVAVNSKSDNIEALRATRHLYDDMVRSLVLRDRRLDILLYEIGYRYDAIHDLLYKNQESSISCLDLCPRGTGKSTVGTIGSAALELICDRNKRILISSETVTQAQNFLDELKKILEHPRVIELFGPFKGRIWHENAIEILGQTDSRKEKSVMVTGVDGSVTGNHFDIIYCDDLVSLKNSRTEAQREKVKQWFYTTLMPCVINQYTKIRIRGTRYHPDDLYDHLMYHDPKFKNSTNIIPALNEEGESNIPDTYTTQFLLEQKESMGSIYFESQYNQNPSGIQGDIFDEVFFRYTKDFPDDLVIFTGVDLAIGLKDQNDKFAVVTVGIDKKSLKIYILNHYAGKLTTVEQNNKIKEIFDKYNPIMVGIESNAFQAAKLQELKNNPEWADIRAVPLFTQKDKVTRAQLLSVRFERGEIYFHKSDKDGDLVEQLLSFPNGRYDDLFDALDFAINTAFRKKKKNNKKRREPGLLGNSKRR